MLTAVCNKKRKREEFENYIVSMKKEKRSDFWNVLLKWKKSAGNAVVFQSAVADVRETVSLIY